MPENVNNEPHQEKANLWFDWLPGGNMTTSTRRGLEMSLKRAILNHPEINKQWFSGMSTNQVLRNQARDAFVGNSGLDNISYVGMVENLQFSLDISGDGSESRLPKDDGKARFRPSVIARYDDCVILEADMRYGDEQKPVWLRVGQDQTILEIYFSPNIVENYIVARDKSGMSRRDMLKQSSAIVAVASGIAPGVLRSPASRSIASNELSAPDQQLLEQGEEITLEELEDDLEEYIETSSSSESKGIKVHASLHIFLVDKLWRNTKGLVRNVFGYNPKDHYLNRINNAMAGIQELGNSLKHVVLYPGDTVSLLPHPEPHTVNGVIDVLWGSRNADPNMGVDATRKWARYTRPEGDGSDGGGGGLCGVSSGVYEAAMSQYVRVNGKLEQVLVPVEMKFHDHHYLSYNDLYGPTMFQDSNKGRSTHFTFVVNPRLADLGVNVRISTETGLIPEDLWKDGVSAETQYNDWVEGGWQREVRRRLDHGEIRSLSDFDALMETMPHIAVNLHVENYAGMPVPIETIKAHNADTYVRFLQENPVSSENVNNAIQDYNESQNGGDTNNSELNRIESTSANLALCGVLRRLGFVPDYTRGQTALKGGLNTWEDLAAVYTDSLPLIKGDNLEAILAMLRIMSEQHAVTHKLSSSFDFMDYSMDNGQVAIAFDESDLKPVIIIKSTDGQMRSYKWDGQTDSYKLLTRTDSMKFEEAFVFPVPEIEATYSSVPVLFTGFEGDWMDEGKQNSSSLMVDLLSDTYQDDKDSDDENKFYLKDLPVSEDDPATAVSKIEEYIEEKMPTGGVVIMMGETGSLTVRRRSVRIEFAAQILPNEIGQDSQAPDRMEMPTELYESIYDKLDAEGLSDKLTFTEGEDTAGDFVCEATARQLMEWSEKQFKANPPRKYLCFFVHVTDAKQLNEEIVSMLKFIAEETQKYYFKYKDDPDVNRFVVRAPVDNDQA